MIQLIISILEFSTRDRKFEYLPFFLQEVLLFNISEY